MQKDGFKLQQDHYLLLPKQLLRGKMLYPELQPVIVLYIQLFRVYQERLEGEKPGESINCSYLQKQQKALISTIYTRGCENNVGGKGNANVDDKMADVKY